MRMSLKGQARHHYKIARSTTLLYELNFYFKLVICENVVATCMQKEQNVLGCTFASFYNKASGTQYASLLHSAQDML